MMDDFASEPPANLKLRSILDLTAAEPLKAEFLSLRGQPISIDASDVDRVGGLCLQVLMSAHKTWNRDGMSFAFHDTSPAFQDCMALLGASSFLSSLTRE